MLTMLVTLFAAATLTIAPSPGASQDRPTASVRVKTTAQLFQRGEQIVEDNCADCVTTANSRNELLEGVDFLKQALRQGYKDEAAIHRLLIVAYSNLGMPELQHSELLALIKADPSDMDARVDWIETLDDGAREISELRKIVAEAPRFARAHYMLAEMLFAGRNLADGTKSLRRWLDTGSPEEIANLSYGVFAGLGIDELRKILKADATVYPAHLVIALKLVDRRGGTDDVQGAVEHARLALAAAPPIVALDYEGAIGHLLLTGGHKNEAAALHREFAAKLKSAEIQ